MGKIDYFTRKIHKLVYITNTIDMNRTKIRKSIIENMKII